MDDLLRQAREALANCIQWLPPTYEATSAARADARKVVAALDAALAAPVAQPPMTREQVVQAAEAAGLRWIPPDDEEYGFPGGFDMATLREVETLILQQRAAQPVGASVAQRQCLSTRFDLPCVTEFCGTEACDGKCFREMNDTVVIAPVAQQAEPVARVLSWTSGSHWRNYELEWLRDVDVGTALYAAPPQPVAQPVQHRLHETDIYDFAGWLTTRPGFMEIGSSKEAGPMAEAVGEYLRTFPERFTAQPVAQSDLKPSDCGLTECQGKPMCSRCVKQAAQPVAPAGWRLVSEQWLHNIKSAINDVAALSLKVERYERGAKAKQMVADVLAAPKEAPRHE